MTEEQLTTLPEKREINLWWRVLATGLLAFCTGIAIIVLTGNPIVFPTVLMLGSFAVPSAYVAFFYDHRHVSRLAPFTILLSFFYGGVLGVFASALLESMFVARLDPLTAFIVGLIEEFTKILGVLVIARHRRHDAELDGLILGAAAGMGFASMESSGYAFVEFLRSGGSLSLVVGVTLLRGILSPVGHGTWTAILASVLFRESSAGSFHINRKVVGAYLMVSVLHGLWDGLPAVIAVLFSPGFDVFIGEAIVGAASLFILWRRWVEARTLQMKQPAP